jgi:putrescine transport system permease protein
MPGAALAPALWLGAFVVVPIVAAFKISLSQPATAMPPYIPVLDLAAGWDAIKAFASGLSAENFATVLRDRLYLNAYLKSLEVALLSTLILLSLGYPLAYAMARAPRRLQSVLLMLVILPFWTAFLIRIYAWITILQRDGVLNKMLLGLGVIDTPVAWLASDTAVYIGIVYSYLPFMVLPIYAGLEKMDPTLQEAAADLGAPPWKAFWCITAPLSAPSVATAALLCFIPIVGEFVIPDLLGNSKSVMIGQTLWTEFFSNRDWPLASAVAISLLAVLLVPIAAYQYLQTRTARSP